MAAALHPRHDATGRCGSGRCERIQHDIARRSVEAAEAMMGEDLPFKVVRSNGHDEVLARASR
jgi:hypothetical protein